MPPVRKGITPPGQGGLVVPNTEHLPLDVVFQGALLKLLLHDLTFSTAIGHHLRPGYFQHPAHRWAWDYCQQYLKSLGTYPSLNLLVGAAQQVQNSGPLYATTLAQVRDMAITDETGIRFMTLDFIKRNVFKQAVLDSKDLFNSGKYGAAYDLMKERMAALDAVTAEPVRRSWLADQFVARHIARQDDTVLDNAIATGVPGLDAPPEKGGVLDGGLRPGELGIWIAYPKAGKTTLLINQGALAVRTQRKRTLHFIREGSLGYIETRYDTIFTSELYSNVKRGHVDPAKYAAAFKEMHELRGLIVLRDFVKTPDANITHIDDEMLMLRRGYGFDPDLIIFDYLDLMRSRFRYDREVEEQKAAAQDLKDLANRGYVVWTASQVRRPDDDNYAEVPHVLRSKNIADCYGKVRIADFIGSINQTNPERDQGAMRLYAELYRDGPADKTLLVQADFSRMTLGAGPAPMSPSGLPGTVPPPMAVPHGGDVKAGKSFLFGTPGQLKQKKVGK